MAKTTRNQSDSFQVAPDLFTQSWGLPPIVRDWFLGRKWVPREHQLDMLEADRAGKSSLLIAPTGAGKTLSGFLPSICDLAEMPHDGLHTLYISPLKALAVDVARNLINPIEEMGLDARVETRTGDTPSSRRQRQRFDPPHILMTTPEQLALMLSHKEAPKLFGNVKRVVLDELHALALSKRGDLLALGLARLGTLCPDLKVSALSATVAHPEMLRDWIAAPCPQREVAMVTHDGGAKPQLSILASDDRVPWAGHSAQYAVPDLLNIIKDNGTSLLFVNTRSQAELLFQSLWELNEESLPIALHHGSLDVEQRRKVEAAMVTGKLRAVVCTSTLDLGIDWGDVDLVMQIGAPKGSSRLLQRIGRANHRLDEPSRAILVPANRFEVLECEAAVEAAEEGAQDSEDPQPGGLDVLAQHILGMACSDPLVADAQYEETLRAWPYRDLSRDLFDRVIEFVATGGYALKAYERYARMRKTEDGTWRISHPKVAQQYRLNVGTIVEEPMLKVRLVRSKAYKRGATTGPIGRGGRVLGEMEEYFLSQLMPGDTFLFGGEMVAFEAIRDNEAYVSRSYNNNPKIPSYMGGKFPLSTYLAERVRATLADPTSWKVLPDQVRDWLSLQRDVSLLPGKESLLVETFPKADKYFMVCYPFEGRLAHQTLGMLLTRRLERDRAKPLGFVASEYALAIWCATDIGHQFKSGRLSLDELFSEDMLGDDLEDWLDESSLMRRTFRNCAIISGLIERRHPGKEKTGRQMTMSSDLIYNVLYEHEPDHILMQATRRDAARGLLDIERLGHCLKRIKRHIIHQKLDRISPLAVPVMLEIGKEPIFGEGRESVLVEAAEELMREATGQ
ncbi:ligase-associated DNA damage response DEXH box helicase [Maritalea mediterranea]|uniref:Ligase-associated DNA damage response DEXH box helicase n=1 Tax=Maritalea mediterranea TaxID=2909667 RepID=A0ABS9E877_9HYPH|nr:ligase-associated DNA damage response DEXH box helicase [Maritalea mediterranea]MCF4097651.1 ligase-associated DNA damage response DEXH box helicase [Maritalea mediterranea]